MDCELAKHLIVESLYDELPSEFNSQLHGHLAECEDCLRYNVETRNTLECLDQAEKIHAPVDLATLRYLIDRRKRHVGFLLSRAWPVWTAISLCAIVFSIFALLSSEIRYEDNALTIRLKGQKAEPLAERTERALADYREEQLKFQKQFSEELRASVASLSQMIEEYKSQRDEQVAGAFQHIQLRQNQMLIAIQKELEILASQTEDEFRRSYMTMAAMAELVDSR